MLRLQLWWSVEYPLFLYPLRPHVEVRYDTKQSNAGALGNAEYPFIAIAPRFTLAQIELNCVFMLNWIVWNKTIYMYKMDLALNNLQCETHSNGNC